MGASVVGAACARGTGRAFWEWGLGLGTGDLLHWGDGMGHGHMGDADGAAAGEASGLGVAGSICDLSAVVSLLRCTLSLSFPIDISESGPSPRSAGVSPRPSAQRRSPPRTPHAQHALARPTIHDTGSQSHSNPAPLSQYLRSVHLARSPLSVSHTATLSLTHKHTHAWLRAFCPSEESIVRALANSGARSWCARARPGEVHHRPLPPPALIGRPDILAVEPVHRSKVRVGEELAQSGRGRGVAACIEDRS